MINCTLVGNSAAQAGGGAWNATINNCILFFNSAPVDANWSSGTLNYCDTSPVPPAWQWQHRRGSPVCILASGDLHLQSNSPCINAGSGGYLYGAVDLDGNNRVSGGILDIGSYEYQGAVAPTILSLRNDNQTVTATSNATFTVTATGTLPLGYQWNENGLPLLGATNSSLTLTNVQVGQSGNYYFVRVTNLGGSIISSNAFLTVTPLPPPPVPGTHYVDANNPTPTSPVHQLGHGGAHDSGRG